MILITGATGFIGQTLVRQLVEAGQDVRLLVRPTRQSPRLPVGIPVEIAISRLDDPRGLRSALAGVNMIYHLAGVEWKSTQASLLEVDIRGTQQVVQAAIEASVQRIFYLSHLGADRGSAYPVFKAKAIAEDIIRRSGLNYTILRTSIIFGSNDGFTTRLAQMLCVSPHFFLIPGDGNTLLQPLWVQDLATCLTWALDEAGFHNQTMEIGGPEQLTFNQVLQILMSNLGIKRRLVSLRPPYLRALTVFLEDLFPTFPGSVYLLDYLGTNRTCALDTVPRFFHLMPSRFSHRLAYLRGQKWQRSFWRSLFQAR